MLNKLSEPSHRLKAAICNMTDDPLGSIRIVQAVFKEITGSFRTRQYEIIVGAYAFAFRIRDDADLVREFYAEEFFKRKSYQQREDALLRMSMAYTLGGLHGAEYDRATAFAYALAPAFDRGDSPECVSASLNEVGIRGLIDLRRSQAKTRRVESKRTLHDIDNSAILEGIDPSCLDDSAHLPSEDIGGSEKSGAKKEVAGKEDDRNDDGSVTGTDGHEEEEANGSPNKKSSQNQEAALRLVLAALAEKDTPDPIILHSSPKMFAKAMRIKVGKEFSFRVVREPSSSEFVRFKVQGISFPES